MLSCVLHLKANYWQVLWQYTAWVALRLCTGLENRAALLAQLTRNISLQLFVFTCFTSYSHFLPTGLQFFLFSVNSLLLSCVTFDQPWHLSLCAVPVSYVISVSMSFGTSYWQFSPSPSLSCQFSYPLHSRQLGSMTQYYTAKVIDPIKTACLWHCRTRIWFTFWCNQITDMAVSWHQPNLSYISCHVWVQNSPVSWCYVTGVDCKPEKTRTLGFNTCLALAWQIAHDSSLTWFFLSCHDKVELWYLFAWHELNKKTKNKEAHMTCHKMSSIGQDNGKFSFQLRSFQ